MINLKKVNFVIWIKKIYYISIVIKKYLTFFGLLTLLLFSYKKFLQYSPKINQKIEEVKGFNTKKEIIPYPKNSELTSEVHSEKYDQVTLKTDLDYKKIKEFYKNILLESGWKLKSQETNEFFDKSQFKKNKTNITIVTTITQENGKSTLVIDRVID